MNGNKNTFQSWFRRGMLTALAVAAAVLWRTQGHTVPEDEPVLTPAPTVQRSERVKREAAYEQDIAALQKMLESGAADAATQEMAAQKLAMLILEHQNELGLENALQEAGFENAVVIVQNGAVTVMIPQEKLTEEASARIIALCVAHADAGAENVRVMGMKTIF